MRSDCSLSWRSELSLIKLCGLSLLLCPLVPEFCSRLMRGLHTVYLLSKDTSMLSVSCSSTKIMFANVNECISLSLSYKQYSNEYSEYSNASSFIQVNLCKRETFGLLHCELHWCILVGVGRGWWFQRVQLQPTVALGQWPQLQHILSMGRWVVTNPLFRSCCVA